MRLMPNDTPLVMSPEQLIAEIVSLPISQRERLRQIDERALDVLYGDQLRKVAEAMYEPPPRLPVPGAWLFELLLWVPIVVLGIEFLRP